jgi:hypothetical protein
MRFAIDTRQRKCWGGSADFESFDFEWFSRREQSASGDGGSNQSFKHGNKWYVWTLTERMREMIQV